MISSMKTSRYQSTAVIEIFENKRNDRKTVWKIDNNVHKQVLPTVITRQEKLRIRSDISNRTRAT